MILVVGGYSQGKSEFANKQFNLENILRLEEFEGDVFSYVETHRDCVIISDEIGCGVVPIEAEKRQRIEYIGRTQIELGKRADEVWRVVCGIGHRIK